MQHKKVSFPNKREGKEEIPQLEARGNQWGDAALASGACTETGDSFHVSYTLVRRPGWATTCRRPGDGGPMQRRLGMGQETWTLVV